MSFPQSTEFPPGPLPGAKVGMCSLLFLLKLWEVLCFTLKVSAQLLSKGSGSCPPAPVTRIEAGRCAYVGEHKQTTQHDRLFEFLLVCGTQIS